MTLVKDNPSTITTKLTTKKVTTMKIRMEHEKEMNERSERAMTVGTTSLTTPLAYLKYLNGKKPCELSMTTYYVHRS